METETVIAPRIKRRVPTEIRIRTYVVLAIFLPCIYAAIFWTKQLDATLLFIGILCIFFLVNHALDWGYQFAFDKERMYQRPKGWRWFFRRLPWYAIRYEDVRRIETIFGADGAAKRQFFPFEFILIYGRTNRDGDNIVIYPPAFQDRAIKDFLLSLYEKRPELFPDDVIDFMHSGKPL
jgi:hypothetical protein